MNGQIDFFMLHGKARRCSERSGVVRSGLVGSGLALSGEARRGMVYLFGRLWY